MATPFLNALSLAPNVNEYPDGPLRGLMQAFNYSDYQKLLGQQMSMQELARQQDELSLQEKRRDLPVNAAKRDMDLVNYQTKKGYIPIMAGYDAERARLENDTASSNLLTADVNRGRIKAETVDQKNKTSALAAKELIERAMSLGPQKGSMYIDQMLQVYRQQGLDIPDVIRDPANWKLLHNGLVNSIAQMQSLGLEDKKTQGNLAVENVRQSGENARNAARIAAQQKQTEDLLKDSNKVPQAYRILSDPQSTDTQRETAFDIVEQLDMERAKQNAKIIMETNPQLMKLSPDDAMKYYTNAVRSQFEDIQMSRPPTHRRPRQPRSRAEEPTRDTQGRMPVQITPGGKDTVNKINEALERTRKGPAGYNLQ